MDSGGFFFLMRHTPNEVISGEKALITFLSNLIGPLSVHCLDYMCFFMLFHYPLNDYLDCKKYEY